MLSSKFATLSTTILLAFSQLAVAVPTNDVDNFGRVKIIADGTSLQTGKLKEKPWIYYASAPIKSGACPPHIAAQIPGCYTVELPKNHKKGQIGQLQSPLVPADGSTYKSWWTSNIPSEGVNIPGETPFYLFEMYSTDGGSFSRVELRENSVYFKNPNTDTYNGPDDLFGFTDRNAFHELEVTTGPNGKVDFNVTDKVTGERLLTFLWFGEIGGPDFSVRVGARRDAVKGQTKFVEHIGELYFAKIA